MLQGLRKGFEEPLHGKVSQDEPQDVHQYQGDAGNFYGEVFPPADDDGQRHGERGKEKAVRHSQHGTYQGGGGMQEGESMDKPNGRNSFHRLCEITQ